MKRNGYIAVLAALICSVAVRAQQPGAVPVLKTEGRLVLVDTVVTDKKGNTIRDLTAKDFRVWEDNDEQKITGVTFESAATAQADKANRYLVLFFDNSTMNTNDQMRARLAAAKFIDANSGPGRLMAVVDFGGTLRIAQNFTTETEQLKKVVAGIKGSFVNPNAGGVGTAVQMGAPDLRSSERDFGARSVLLALRTLAKNMANVPGRKTLVMLTSGFVLNAELQSELTAAINACNRANVAIYPIDVRGLIATGTMGALTPLPGAFFHVAGFWPGSVAFLQKPGGPSGPPAGMAPGVGGGSRSPGVPGGGQSPGGGSAPGAGRGGGTGTTPGAPGGGKTGGTPGGTTAGTTGGSRPGGGATGTPVGRGGGANPYPSGQPWVQNPFATQMQRIMPNLMENVVGPQQVLYLLAQGTGGFVIVNSNDLVAGLTKIARDLNEYYVITYVPEASEEGQCHQLKVKVGQGAVVRARSGYCNAKPLDLLAGNPIEKDLEKRVTGSEAGNIQASMQLPYFYTAPETARVNVAIEMPLSTVKFEKKKGKLRTAVNVLGIAYLPDGGVGARFSDTVNLEFANKKELEEFSAKPFHYENQFEIASGKYTLKVAFSAGSESYGRLESPLAVDPYDGNKFSLSSVALSNTIHRVDEMDTSLTAQLLEDRKPLVVLGNQITPSGSNRFKKTDVVGLYTEIYAPLLASAKEPPAVGLQMRIVERSTGQQKSDSGFMRVPTPQAGNPVVPVGLRVPVDTLDSGSYRLEIKAIDEKGNASPVRSADVEVMD